MPREKWVESHRMIKDGSCDNQNAVKQKNIKKTGIEPNQLPLTAPGKKIIDNTGYSIGKSLKNFGT